MIEDHREKLLVWFLAIYALLSASSTGKNITGMLPYYLICFRFFHQVFRAFGDGIIKLSSVKITLKNTSCIAACLPGRWLLKDRFLDHHGSAVEEPKIDSQRVMP